MGGRSRRLRARLACERGYAFPELIVATAIGLVVAATAGMIVVTLLRSQRAVSERAGQIQQGRTMVESLGRELRQGESIVAATDSALELITYVSTGACGANTAGASRLCRVSYSCGLQSCTRTERNADGTGTPSTREVVSGITGPGVFSYDSAPGTEAGYIEIELVFPREGGEEAVTVRDGVALRNHAQATGP